MRKTLVDKSMVLAAIASGEYVIESHHACDCYVSDINNQYGVIIEGGNDCYLSNTLSAHGDIIAEYIQFDGIVMHVAGIAEEDIPESIRCGIEIDDSESNPSHDMEAKILDYLNNLPVGTKYYRDNLRGFANEYKIYIVYPDADTDGFDFEGFDELTAEEAAPEIAYKGDDVTQAYNTFEVIE